MPPAATHPPLATIDLNGPRGAVPLPTAGSRVPRAGGPAHTMGGQVAAATVAVSAAGPRRMGPVMRA